MRIVAQLNDEGFFLYPAPAYGEGMPGGAIEIFPPGHWEDDAFVSDEVPEHHRWRYNGTDYEPAPDYRGQQVYQPDGTSYYPDAWGPLPEGDSLSPLPPTLEELAQQRTAQLKSELSALDAASARALRAVLLDTQNGVTPSGEDLAQLAVYEAEAVALRDELAALGG